MRNPEVYHVLNQLKKWQEELSYLRDLTLTTGLEETIKWGMPTYTLNGTNVFILSDFKEYFTINFFKGIVLKDPLKILTTHGDNQQSSRVIKMTSLAQVKELTPVILDFMKESIANEQQGVKIEKRNIEASIVYPDELLTVFQENREL